MSPVIYTPPDPCSCQPPMRKIGPGLAAVPAYRVDTIWACGNCGQRWIVVAMAYAGLPIADHIAGRTITRTGWKRHDKDTP